MKKLINETIIPILNQGNISVEYINNLIELKKFVDRIATRKYTIDEMSENLKEKYGEEPRIITWGDYFQSEIATNTYKLSYDEFTKKIYTIKFDIMSAYEIFSEQTDEFFIWIEDSYNEIISHKTEDYCSEENEIIHLKILKDYYTNMKIEDNFTIEEKLWYNSFFEKENAIIS